MEFAGAARFLISIRRPNRGADGLLRWQDSLGKAIEVDRLPGFLQRDGLNIVAAGADQTSGHTACT